MFIWGAQDGQMEWFEMPGVISELNDDKKYKCIRAHLHLFCPSIRVRVSVQATDRIGVTLHLRLGHPRQWQFLVACSSDHVNQWLSTWALHNLGRTRTSVSKEIATRSNELGHRCLRQKSWTRTQINVNTKHQFTCFHCVRAQARMLRPRSRM